MNLLVSNFSGMANIAASTRRLRELLDAMDSIPPKMLVASHVEDAGYIMRVDGLLLHTPPPSAQLLCSGLSFELQAGDSMLIMGRSGGGKSSLLRCCARLWDATEGSVTFGCGSEDISFLPQQPYLPLGSLRDILLYPTDPLPATTDQELISTLDQAGLPDLATEIGGLDAVVRWAEVLSHGEQQRVAFARLFLRPPVCVLLDEATSALDIPTETMLYRRLSELEPTPTIISVGHRESLIQFHARLLTRKEASAKWSESISLT